MNKKLKKDVNLSKYFFFKCSNEEKPDFWIHLRAEILSCYSFMRRLSKIPCETSLFNNETPSQQNM